MPQAPSTRWCPTPEQLMMLEEMYRGGLRTPNALQIQSITAHLSYYGKIEGKNVFYWFQNHKARDRQKLRKRLNRHHQMLPQQHYLAQQPFPTNHQIEASYGFLRQASPQFLQQGLREEVAEAMSLISKHGRCEREEEQQRSVETSPMTSGYEWRMLTGASTGAPSSCRPLRTLDLFPTRITGLRGDGIGSKSSSCSASTK
ncbi:unnamed protein product [Spirodela intermedia]|uniref:Homeobox domain-containing protein n=2 Tax=Spirodela intermedia TaxID=51605 RepID=A0A7I8L923_SPIIN|nr:unnamed protein product [Spirodela intermedia]CAA6669345.1 unnamed protein product [Spirodela intermedia]CAA7406292.1 unnamed protein product [Spirodela intermedia]